MDVPNQQIGDMLFAITKSLKALTEKELKPLGLGTGQLQILMRFYAAGSGGFTQNELVTLLQIDKGNISRNMAKLVEKNYLMQKTDGSRSYELTEEGRRLKEELVRFLGRIHHIMVAGMDPDMLRVTGEGMSRILANLEESV